MSITGWGEADVGLVTKVQVHKTLQLISHELIALLLDMCLYIYKT